MTRVNKLLEDMRSYKSNHVTFGDGAKGEIMGIGKLINDGLSDFDNVLLVKGCEL